MDVQVLIATMNQEDHSLLEKMNIQTNAIVGNQCNYNKLEHFSWNGCKITYLNFSEWGVGLNRNNALMRATDDICLIADDDMVFLDGYETIVKSAFERYRDADIIIFNLVGRDSGHDKTIKAHRVMWHNYLRYGAARVAFRLKSVRRSAIYFNQCFGGGTEFSHGEDTLFLAQCLKSGLRIYAVPEFLAELKDDRCSTWDNGYNEKYFYDQGCLYRAISKHWWKLLCVQDIVRHHLKRNIPPLQIYRIMKKGGRGYSEK